MSPVLPLRFYIFILCGLLIANISVYQLIFAPDTLTISVIKAGKGNVILLQSPHEKTFLIDSGSDASIVRALGTTLPPWQRTIDVLVLTGRKIENTGGLPYIEQRYHVQKRIDVGTIRTPYGTGLSFKKGVVITIISSGIFSISNGTTAKLISSSTPQGTYNL